MMGTHRNSYKDWAFEERIKDKKNKDIRRAIHYSNIESWRVADKLGKWDSNFSRDLRYEISDEYKARIYKAILECERERDHETY